MQKTVIPSEQATGDVDSSASDSESINSADPLFAMEAKLTKLKKLSLSEAAELTFNELIKNVVLKVSRKRYQEKSFIFNILIIVIINLW